MPSAVVRVVIDHGMRALSNAGIRMEDATRMAGMQIVWCEREDECVDKNIGVAEYMQKGESERKSGRQDNLHSERCN